MTKKISIQLCGGIGNNLFQIANAYAYSLKYNKELVLINNKQGATHGSLSSYSDNILNKINFQEKYDFSNFKIQSELVFNYIPIPKFNHNVYLNGYFQSEKYFIDFESEIRELFSYEVAVNKELSNLLENENTCSIHVRRGDYVNLPNHHPTQNMNYYMKAIKKMPKDSVFLIFSDDIKWCKESFPDLPEKFIFIEGNKDYEDLYLMSKCNNNIICNSTFSWWAAWLNRNLDKVVIAPNPDNWFGSAMSNHNTKDIIPESWIKI